ncbi:peptidoglycan-binding domain-containing protein [Streptomyces griseoloalbus]|uniref:Peptidoglycan-binding domain-containing protein n=1 Tax=Streptomyces griseoloalbus TaxID=67303 RepID=A0ABV3E5E1_9ACTN
MRAITKALVGVTTAVGIAAGGVVTAGTATAAPAPAQEHVVSADVAPLAVVNLGLTREEARKVQRWLATHWNYNGAIDGYLGTGSWKAFQRCLAKYWDYNDEIDGIVGPNTIKALQRLLRANGYYSGAIDGIAGDGTRAAFKVWANKL